MSKKINMDVIVFIAILSIVIGITVFISLEYFNPYKQAFQDCRDSVLESIDLQTDYTKLREELCDVGIFDFCGATTQMRVYGCDTEQGYSLNCQDWRGFKLCKNVTCSPQTMTYTFVFKNNSNNGG